jgi:hypothetical protein
MKIRKFLFPIAIVVFMSMATIVYSVYYDQTGWNYLVRGFMDLVEQASEPPTPGPDVLRCYSAVDGTTTRPYCKDQDGTVYEVYTDGTDIDGENIADGTVDDDALDLTGEDGLTCTDLDMSDCNAVTGSSVSSSTTVSAGTSVTAATDITATEDSTGGNAGARSNIIGVPLVGLAALGTMTNGSTETTSYIDDTPTGEWAEVDAGTAVALTADATYYRIGAASMKIALTADAVAGDGADGTITGDDLTSNESIGFWIMSDVTLTAGDFTLTLDDDDASPDWSGNVPAVATADKWTWVEVDISGCDGGGNDCNVVDGVHILLSSQGETNLDAVNVYIDGMWKWDADDEETVGQNLVQDGVLGVIAVATAAGSANTTSALTEDTDFFIHYQTGNDAIVTVTDQSANSGLAMIAYQ